MFNECHNLCLDDIELIIDKTLKGLSYYTVLCQKMKVQNKKCALLLEVKAGTTTHVSFSVS